MSAFWIAQVLLVGLLSYMGLSLGGSLEGLRFHLLLLSLLVPYLMILSWVMGMVGRRSDPSQKSTVGEFFQPFAYLGMAYLSFLLVFTLGRDLASLVTSADLRTPLVSLVIPLASLLAVACGFIGARHRIRVKTVEVPIVDLDARFEGFRIVQLSDLHISQGIRAAFLDKIVRIANDCEPDLTVLTGDIADSPVGVFGGDAGSLEALKARHGKFYVTGNHEYYWNGPSWVQRFSELGMMPLLNRHHMIETGGGKLLLAGVPDPAASQFGLEAPDVGACLVGAPAGAHVKILLSHQTRHAAAPAARLGFDLMLSGHTHGGQFFPWTLLVSAIDRYPHGLRKLEDLWIYVSRGTGYWGPPVRLGAPPEVTLLVLKAAR